MGHTKVDIERLGFLQNNPCIRGEGNTVGMICPTRPTWIVISIWIFSLVARLVISSRLPVQHLTIIDHTLKIGTKLIKIINYLNFVFNFLGKCLLMAWAILKKMNPHFVHDQG